FKEGVRSLAEGLALPSEALEKQALSLVEQSGERGLLQCDLWKLLKTDSREGSRIVSKLEKKGLIKREPVLHNGRKTFRIVLVKKPELKISISSIRGIPCFSCLNIHRCGIGQPISPVTCKELNEYLEAEASKLDS
ncbi:MAG: hypothetical protein DRJ31_06510, partial [Candidatus Methanomethylicota archaeon]